MPSLLLARSRPELPRDGAFQRCSARGPGALRLAPAERRLACVGGGRATTTPTSPRGLQNGRSESGSTRWRRPAGPPRAGLACPGMRMIAPERSPLRAGPRAGAMAEIAGARIRTVRHRKAGSKCGRSLPARRLLPAGPSDRALRLDPVRWEPARWGLVGWELVRWGLARRELARCKSEQHPPVTSPPATSARRRSAPRAGAKVPETTTWSSSLRPSATTSASS